jgi:hypothetical protein
MFENESLRFLLAQRNDRALRYVGSTIHVGVVSEVFSCKQNENSIKPRKL